MAIAVVIPGQFGDSSPVAQLYARRRLMVGLCLTAIVLVLFLSTGHVVANRGGAPASASMIRPASATSPSSDAVPVAAPAAANLYIVQPGDTLWSIGQRFHGNTVLADYVDALVATNGGTVLQVSQALTLP